MPLSLPSVNGAWSLGGSAPATGTAIAALIPPYSGFSTDGIKLFQVTPPTPSVLNGWVGANWIGPEDCYTHITSVNTLQGSTANIWYIMAPTNWTYTTAAAAKNTSSLFVPVDPGLYSVNFRYPLASGVTKPAGVADAALASGDYLAYQLLDGTWQVNTTNTTYGGTTAGAITLATALPNVTGGGVAANSPVFLFKIYSASLPYTGNAQWSSTPKASTGPTNLFAPDPILSGFSAVHKGDPLLIFNPNVTAASVLMGAAGFYSQW
jgi:hypothetical protein